MSKFIPTGRTSLIKAGGANLQVQTEYAYRPFPRITSTILSDGKVLHKLEKKLELPVDSTEEQQKVEEYIKKQHSVILETIHAQTSGTGKVSLKPSSKEKVESDLAEIDSTPEPAPFDHRENVEQRIASVPGTQDLYHISNLGDFLEPGFDKKFRDEFPSEFRGIREFLEIFPVGRSGQRERGVYEIKRDRLYLISLGDECYFAAVRRNDGETRYERAYKAAIADTSSLFSEA